MKTLKLNFAVPTVFKSNDSRYELKTAFNVVIPPLLSLAFVSYIFWVFMMTTYNFFKANGFPESENFKEVFFDSILTNIAPYFPYMLTFFLVVFFLGVYMARLLLRPIHCFGKMCTQKQYISPGVIEKNKLLIKFASIFFQNIHLLKKRGSPTAGVFHEGYAKITSPPQDKIFYLQYGLFLMIVTLTAIIGLYFLTYNIYESMMALAQTITKAHDERLTNFLMEQWKVLDSILFFSLLLMVVLYLFQSQKIVSQINGVSYAFFRTMKEVLGGNKNKRIYLRLTDPGHDMALKFNSFLDEMTGLIPSHSSQLDLDSDDDEEEVEKYYEIVTPDGYRISKIDKEEVTDVLIKLRL